MSVELDAIGVHPLCVSPVLFERERLRVSQEGRLGWRKLSRPLSGPHPLLMTERRFVELVAA